MKSIKYLTILIFIALFKSCQAQIIKFIGLRGGYNCTKLYAYNWDINLLYRKGIQYGIVSGFRITDKLTLALEYMSVEKNVDYYKLFRTDHVQLKYVYMTIPIYLNTSLDNKNMISINNGIYYEKAWLYANPEEYKKSGIGLLAGLRLKSPSYHKFSFILDGQINTGLTPTIIRHETNETVKTKFISFLASLGTIYNITKKTKSNE